MGALSAVYCTNAKAVKNDLRGGSQMNNENVSYSLNNVFDIFTGQPLNRLSNRIVRIAPELDDLEILYSNDSSPNKLYSLKIVCWALREDGDVFAMVPWLNQIVPAPDINDPLNGRWEGYHDPKTDEIFYMPPHHKILELESAHDHFQTTHMPGCSWLQEIPDVIGTHAVLTNNGFKSFSLIEVLSWRLTADGQVHGMLVDDNQVRSTPVLPGESCLYSAQSHEDFKYFFQHRIANKIKEQDPEALAAIAMLIEQ